MIWVVFIREWGNSWPRWWLNDHLICIKGGWVVDIWDPLAEGGWGG